MTDENTAVIAGFDLSDMDTVDESRMTVAANGKPTDWIWTFAGPGHPRSVEQSNRMSRERLYREQQQEQARVNGKKWKAPEENIDELRAKNVGFVVERLLGWSTVKLNGQEFPFTPDSAKAILLDPKKGSLLVQALEFLGEESSFTKRSVGL